MIEDRFFAKVEYVGTHGFWTGAKHADSGYGWFYMNRELGSMTANRAFLVITTGINPKGMDAAHTCDYRDCVIHVQWETRQENNQDYTKTITHCPQGHEYSDENTLISQGTRKCRVCNRNRMRDARHIAVMLSELHE